MAIQSIDMKITLNEFKALSLQSRQRTFLLWLNQQPAEDQYWFFAVTECPMARFAQELSGSKTVKADENTVYIPGNEPIKILGTTAQIRALMVGNRTYGWAAQRLAKVI